MIRPPSQFGGHEANADILYVEVYEILPDPEEEDDFPYPYQPVRVKQLQFTEYVPASSGVVSTDNSDIVIRTVKSRDKHGNNGNGIEVVFELDSGITPNVEADFDEATDELTITVKNDEVTWEEVAAAVALVLSGAFILEAAVPSAEVGSSIASVTATLTGGEDGGYGTIGEAFGVGGRELKDLVAVEDKFWVTWRTDAQRWDQFKDGNISVRGGVAVAGDDIDAPVDQTWDDVPAAVQALVTGGTPAGSDPCWKLTSGEGTLYQLIEDPDNAGDYWMVPVPSTTTLYNMAGEVSGGHALQVKQFTVRSGGTTKQILLIDVEKC